MITTIEELKKKVMDRWSKLDDVRSYLNDEGLAEAEALRAIYWVSHYARDLEDLLRMEEYKKIREVADKHENYYKTFTRIEMAIGRARN